MTTKRTPKPKLDLPDKIPDLIALGYHVVACGNANAALLVNPNPTPAAINTATGLLEQANTAAGQRTKGAVPARSKPETALRNLLEQWGTYLFGIAATMPGQEAYVYESGGFGPRANATRVVLSLKLTQPGASGTAHAACKAAPHGLRVFYGWRISLDGGKTWTTSQTNTHVTDFSNIPSGTLIEVQSNTTIKNVVSDWSASAKLLVK